MPYQQGACLQTQVDLFTDVNLRGKLTHDGFFQLRQTLTARARAAYFRQMIASAALMAAAAVAPGGMGTRRTSLAARTSSRAMATTKLLAWAGWQCLHRAGKAGRSARVDGHVWAGPLRWRCGFPARSNKITSRSSYKLVMIGLLAPQQCCLIKIGDKQLRLRGSRM